MKPVYAFVAITTVLGCVSCSQHGKHRYEVASRYETADTAAIVNGRAIPPRNAPLRVKRAIAAANNICGLPYKWGGGHGRLNDTGYDCSGATSYVLRNAGLLEDQMPSRGFLKYGNRGEGKWITICARDGHVYLEIAGLRFDTQGQSRQDGPKWRADSRSKKGHAVRHPAGF